MQIIPLQSVPNQELSCLLDGLRYVITLKELDSEMCMVTIERDGVVLVSNARAVAGYAILRYQYLQQGAGNFAFVTANDEYPHYSKFNTTQQLIYASDAEIEALDV